MMPIPDSRTMYEVLKNDPRTDPATNRPKRKKGNGDGRTLLTRPLSCDCRMCLAMEFNLCVGEGAGKIRVHRFDGAYTTSESEEDESDGDGDGGDTASDDEDFYDDTDIEDISENEEFYVYKKPEKGFKMRKLQDASTEEEKQEVRNINECQRALAAAREYVRSRRYNGRGSGQFRGY